MNELHPEVKSALDGIKTSVESFNDRIGALQRQVDAIDLKTQSGRMVPGEPTRGATAGLLTKFQENREAFLRHGRLQFEAPSLLERKAITSSGIITPAAETTFGDTGRFPYGQVRLSMASIPVEGGSVFRVKETSNGFEASPQSEGLTKNESTATLTADTLPVQTIATWVSVSKQALDDVPGLEQFLGRSLIWALEKETEEQIIAGDGTGQNLTGLTTVADAFDTSILSTVEGWTYADVLAAAGVQLLEYGAAPTHYLVNPRDWFLLETLRDSTGQYILGRPREAMQAALWGKVVIPTAAVSRGTFLACDMSRGVVRQRQAATVDMSMEHGDNFVKNLVTIRIEERLALVSMGRGFIYGSLTTSPA